jgi:hypothetical protein
MTPHLNEKYLGLGFELSKDGHDSLILKYQGDVVCIIGSRLEIMDKMLSRICDEYLDNIGADRS